MVTRRPRGPEEAVVEAVVSARAATDETVAAANQTQRLAGEAAERAGLAATVLERVARDVRADVAGGTEDDRPDGLPWIAVRAAAEAAARSRDAAHSAAETAVDAKGAANITAGAARLAIMQAAEQGALRRVATLVARGASSADVFAAVGEEVARLFESEAGELRQAGDGCFVPVGSWSRHAGAGSERSARIEESVASVSSAVRRTGRPARGRDASGGGAVEDEEERISAAVRIGDDLWGVLEAAGPLAGAFPAGAEVRLGDFAELVGIALANEEARGRLAEMADRDPLTGLPNHRSFQRLLRREFEVAGRHARGLSVVMVDVDNFRNLNDAFGHRVGDDVIVEVVRRLRACCREGDVVARVGGDEFALLLPDTHGDAAHRMACRGHESVRGRPIGPVPQVTVSIGICDRLHAATAGDLLRLADGALYWAKAKGRDAVCAYTPTGPEALSAAERAERVARTQALAGLRALARAIDAKDSSTMQHSERVARLARRLALSVGWDSARAAMLAEVALVHDVGKIGVPDAVLLKPGRLTASEYDVVKEHACLGAKITSEILGEEQVAWLRGHHERFDGAGYPDGLAGTNIPDGSRLLALVDSYDAMTASRSYCPPVPVADALAECRIEAGRQFDPQLVRSLDRLLALGEMD